MLDSPPTRDQYSDLSVRFATALILAAVALIALWMGGGVFSIFAGAMTALMVAELLAVLHKDRSASRLLRLCLVGCAAYAGAAAGLWPPSGIAFAACGLALAALAGRDQLSMATVLGFGIICMGVTALCYLRSLPGGFWVVLWVVLVVVACDTGAYFAGRRFGGRKLWPRISPKKTWSGFWGGFGLAVVVSALVGVFLGGKVFAMMLMGCLMAVVSVGGDLFESAFKRRHNVKDAGGLLPGHGGLLDRFDGLIAVVLFVALASVFVDLPQLVGAAADQANGIK